MGANQSSGCDGSGSAQTQANNQVKHCYYDLLGVSQTATDEEIKRAYRSKALQLHPDRNYGNVEATTQLFAEIQSAYEVLSDSQERAWYDSHRDAILGGDKDGSNTPYEHNVRMTTSHDVLQTIGRFHGQADFTDSPTGFFSALQGIFANLANEEAMACGWEGVEAPSYPSFGCANDDYQNTVRPFYAVWTVFATQKAFTWKDIYKYSEAPDRRMRRLMEKENRRLREEGVREFNDAVRSLVVFVRKRDPRVKSGKETEADRQRILRDAALAQAARSRAANRSKTYENYPIPDWTNQNVPEETSIFEEESSVSSEETFQCVLCNKFFKSEKQYNAHERSKKHSKALRQVQKEMQQDDAGLALHYSSPSEHDISNTSSDGKQDQDEAHSAGFQISQTSQITMIDNSCVGEFTDNEKATSVGYEVVDDGGTSSATQLREAHAENPVPSRIKDDSDLESLSQEISSKPLLEPRQPKLGKAKEKRARKAAQVNPPDGVEDLVHRCTSCHAGFPSKTKLFSHIKEFPKHAQPVTTPTQKKKRK